MKEYNDILETVKTILKDRDVNRAGAESIKFSTGYNAVAFCRDFKEWREYDALFERLKADLKKINIKFAGTPLHKACLTVATATIDCAVKIKGSDGQAFEDFKELLKQHSLTFSSKQSEIRYEMGAATDDDTQKIFEKELKRLESAIDTVSELSDLLSADQAEKIISILEMADSRKKAQKVA